jgi:tRNA-dihydrouridine synthase 3
LWNRYIISSRVPQPVIDDDAAECKTNHVADGPSIDVRDRRDARDGPVDGEAEEVEGNKRQKLSKEEKKARTGQNKGRRFKAMQDEVKVCKSWVQSGVCDFGER